MIYILLLLLLSSYYTSGFQHVIDPQRKCGVDACAVAYTRTMEYEGLREAEDERFCEVLSTYWLCLNTTAQMCRGDIKYHISLTATSIQWHNNDCDRLLQKMATDGRKTNKCHLTPTPSSQSSFRHCALWGDPHIRAFDGSVHACAEAGARPLIDNRYFLVQVSSGRVREDSMVTAVSKVTLIVREHSCTTPKRYEAASETEHLPIAFVDGTTRSTVEDIRSVDITSHSSDHIEISLKHAATTIHIRRRGPYLSVSITLPHHVLAQDSHPSTSLPLNEQMCHAGCPLSTLVPLPAALSNPSAFSECHASPILTPVKLATERCKAMNVSDDFFDACVFDLMLTGDELLVTMSKDVQNDLEKELSQGRPYSVGRVDLSLYEHLVNHNWTSCSPPRPSSSVPCRLWTTVATVLLGLLLFR